MPKEKNQHKSTAASDEKFRDFFTTTVADIPAEMVRREEEAAEEHKGLFGRLFGHAKPKQAPQAGTDLELPTGEVLLGADALAKPDGEEPLDLDLTLRTADPGTDFPQPKAEVPAAPEKPAVPDRPAPQPAPENKPEPPKAPATPAPQPEKPRKKAAQNPKNAPDVLLPQEQQEQQTPVQSRVPALGGLCLMVSTLAAVGVGWTAACIVQPTLLGSESQLMTRLLIALFGAQAFGAIGLADDAARLRSRAQLGLRCLPRLALEAAAAAAVLVLLAVNGCLPTGLQLPGAGYVELGGAALVLWGLVLVALAECARTADGADGTVCGTAFAAMLGLMMLETRLGWFPLAVLPAALAGALLAFLLWNFPPAKLRPGSCGCLYLAGVLGCVPLCIGYAELSIPLALPFWAEGGMVLLQILYHRITGRPLFRAAPLHRWLEKRGMSAVNIFYSLCALSVCGLALAVRLARWA